MEQPISTKRIAIRSIDIDKVQAVLRFTDDSHMIINFSEPCDKDNISKIKPGDVVYMAYGESIALRKPKDLLWVDVHVDTGEVIEILVTEKPVEFVEK